MSPAVGNNFVAWMELFGPDGVSPSMKRGEAYRSPFVSSTPAQRALDIAEAAASMRRFYISLGMRPETLRRTIALAKTTSQPLAHETKPPKRGKRAKAS